MDDQYQDDHYRGFEDGRFDYHEEEETFYDKSPPTQHTNQAHTEL